MNDIREDFGLRDDDGDWNACGAFRLEVACGEGGENGVWAVVEGVGAGVDAGAGGVGDPADAAEGFGGGARRDVGGAGDVAQGGAFPGAGARLPNGFGNRQVGLPRQDLSNLSEYEAHYVLGVNLSSRDERILASRDIPVDDDDVEHTCRHGQHVVGFGIYQHNARPSFCGSELRDAECVDGEVLGRADQFHADFGRVEQLRGVRDRGQW